MSAPDLAAIRTRGRNDVSLRRSVVAAALSAWIPGSGQLLLRQKRAGVCLLVLFAVLIVSLFLLRLPKFLLGFDFVLLGWAALSLCGCSTAVYAKSNPPPSKLWWIFIVLCVVIALNVVFVRFFRLAGFRTYIVNSSAMKPTLSPGDHILVDAHAFSAHAPQRNDIVVIKRDGSVVVKRVIAIGGDTIEGKDRIITINGSTLNEPFVRHSEPPHSSEEQDTFGPFTVPAGEFFVMGDNRDISLDSRHLGYGVVDAPVIIGKYLYNYRPNTHQDSGIRWLHPLTVFKSDK